jgi:carbon storage regulator
MLVLSRYENQSVIINDNIRVTVVDIHKTKTGAMRCRIGIEAPKEISVHRQEVWLAIHCPQPAETEPQP